MTYRGIHILIGSNAENHADITKDGSDDNALDDNQLQDAPRFSTYSFTNAELMGTLFDGNQHDVRDAHDAREQREKTHNPQGLADDADTFLHLHILCITVPQIDSTLVIRMSLMGSIDTLTVFLLKSFILCFSLKTVESKLYASCVIRLSTINTFDGTIR